MWKTIAPSALIFVAVALPAAAIEPGGTISGTVGGEPVETTIWASQSDYDDYGTGGTGGSVSLMTLDLNAGSGLGTAAIGFEASSFAAGQFNTVEIRIRIKTDSNQIYTATLDDGLTLALDKAVVEDGFLNISGTLDGTLTRGAVIGKERDPADTLPMALQFDAVVSPLE